ncbi:hypothetical protein JVU11DRAFT_7410 [Chiua virens]|nr:hypothetical protein JVU11DRAFT_7410 [Chiua virens]
MATPPAVRTMASHISDCLKAHRTRFSAHSRYPPLFVGVQGPQGSGKTFLTSRLRSLLADPPYSLSVAVLSIDDLYLPHRGLMALAETHPQNRLLHGRGQPGTHDIQLGREILRALKTINDSRVDQAKWPCRYLIRAYLMVRAIVPQRLRWSVGQEEVEERWRQSVPGLVDFDMQAFVSLEDVLEVNDLLASYIEWWQAFNAFIQIKGPSTSPYAVIYRWRLQQEHDMKAKNGGRGMTDAQVKTFVDRYIPGYVFFGDGIRKGAVGDHEEKVELPPWQGHGLVVELDLERKLQSTSQF